MSGMLRWRPFARRVAAAMVAAGLFAGGKASGDDLVTLSGTTYHDVRPVRVEPDGVTWQYAEGVCKVDFADSPKSVCAEYHYDPAKATAYRDAQTQTRRQAEEQTRQILQDNEARHAARMQAEAAARMSQAGVGADMIFRRAASPAASDATRALGEQLAAAAAKTDVPRKGPVVGTTEKVFDVLTGLGLLHYSHPAEVTNANEYKTDLHHAPSDGYAQGGAQDGFYVPAYLTKSYNDDMDRAAAFARDVPLKP